MRTIPYTTRVINPDLTYHIMRPDDVQWVLEQCHRLVNANSPVLDVIHPGMRTKITGKKNSARSLCQGIIENFSKRQFDISEKQCKGLTFAFVSGACEIEDFEDVEFVHVDKLPKVVSPKVEINTLDNTIFSDLFDLSQYHLEVRIVKN